MAYTITPKDIMHVEVRLISGDIISLDALTYPEFCDDNVLRVVGMKESFACRKEFVQYVRWSAFPEVCFS